MQLYRTSLYLIRISLDMTILLLSFAGSALLLGHHFEPFSNSNVQFILLFLSMTWFFSSKSLGMYDDFRSRNFSFELILLLKGILIQMVSIIILLFLLKENGFRQDVIILFALMSIFLISIERFFLRKFLNFMRRKGRNIRSLLIIGAGEVGKKFFDTIKQNPHFGYNVIGFLDDEKKAFLNGQYLGRLEELDRVLSKQKVDNVIIALPNSATARIEEVVRTCERHTTRIKIIPDYFRLISSKYNVTMFGDFPIISVGEDRLNEMHWRILKRIFDIVISLFFLIFVVSWSGLIIGILVKLSSHGPVFFKQERWGRDNKKFVTYKFRTMRYDSDETDNNGRIIQVKKNDPRVTRIGMLLRKTSLDELPQFWNVFKGEMSIVGPRPHPTPLNLESKDKIHLYMLRHLVKPGITGWAQVNGFRGNAEELGMMQKRIDSDIWYIENWTFWLDIQIIILTAWRMIKGDPNAY